MKRWLPVLLIMGLISLTSWGCGNLKEELEKIDPQTTASISDTITQVSQDLLQMDELTGSSLNFEGLTADIGMEIPASSPSTFAPLAETWDCDPPLNEAGPHQCTYTRDNFPPNDEKSRVTLFMTIDEGEDGKLGTSDDIVSKFQIQTSYKDGTTSVTTVEEDPDDQDDNLATGWVIVTEIRYFSDTDAREKMINKVWLNQGEDPFSDKDNLLKKATSTLIFRNGDNSTYSIEVSPAVPNGYVGRYVWINVKAHWEDPEIKLSDYSEVTTLETDLPPGEDMVAQGEVNFSYIYNRKDFAFKDGSTAWEYAEKISNVVKYRRKTKFGGSGEGEINLDTGEYHFVHYFPENAPLEKIEQSGILAKFNNNHGNLTRTVYFANGRTRTFTAEVTLDPEAHTRTLNFTRSDGWKGTIVQKMMPLRYRATGDAVNIARELHINYVLDIYADRSARFAYQKDKLNTSQNPDETGEFYFYPDGSMQGTVTVYNEDGSRKVYHIKGDSQGNFQLSGKRES